MKVCCTRVSLQAVDLQDITDKDGSYVGYSPINMDGFQIGQEYIVMGVLIYREISYMYYLLDLNNGYPYWHPYSLFDITNNTLPESWSIKIFSRNEHPTVHSIIGFSELCNIGDFDQNLSLSEIEQVNIYFKRKEQLIIELYPEMLHDYNPNNKLILIDQADNYVMCEHCTYAWGIASDKKNIACPKCSQIYKNPFLPSHRGMDITKSL